MKFLGKQTTSLSVKRSIDILDAIPRKKNKNKIFIDGEDVWTALKCLF